MDVINALLFWIHLAALALGGATVFGMPVLGAQMAGATPEGRQTLGNGMRRLSTMGRGALVGLIITGPLLFWLKWDFSAPSAMWFGIKMLLVLILLGLVIFAGINAKRAFGGDQQAIVRGRQISMANIVTYLAIILSAVLAFG